MPWKNITSKSFNIFFVSKQISIYLIDILWRDAVLKWKAFKIFVWNEHLEKFGCTHLFSSFWMNLNKNKSHIKDQKIPNWIFGLFAIIIIKKTTHIMVEKWHFTWTSSSSWNVTVAASCCGSAFLLHKWEYDQSWSEDGWN